MLDGYVFDGYVIEYAIHIANWRHGISSSATKEKDLRIWKREKDDSLKIFRQMAMYNQSPNYTTT